MVKLINITRKNNYIFCDIFIEDCVIPISAIYNIVDNRFEQCDLPDEYGWCTNHINHAKEFLKTMTDINELPTEKTIYWC